MKLEFYHWSYQCPLNNQMIHLLQEYQDRLAITIQDISNQPELARELQMFFPTLLVVNGKHRYYSPIHKAFLDQLCKGILPKELPYQPVQGTQPYKGRLVPLTKETIPCASTCTGCVCEADSKQKYNFLKSLPVNTYGWLHLNPTGELLGGAEYVPSQCVPYDIPRGDEIAFITCVYMSDETFDYKSYPLQKLEEELKKTYKKVIVISDEVGTFPNGSMEFFKRNGYQDTGILFRDSYCTLHLMEKELLSL